LSMNTLGASTPLRILQALQQVTVTNLNRKSATRLNSERGTM
jgi:hypothetical protein